MSHSGNILKKDYQDKEGEHNMCQALLDLIEDSREEGRKDGISMGEAKGEAVGIQLARQVIRLQMNGCSDNEIASACGIPLEKVRQILL